MSIERMERADLSLSISRAAEPKVAADHSSSRIAEDSDNDGFMSLDELRLKNQVKDQALKGSDLDGDGIVSLREAVLAANNLVRGGGADEEDDEDSLSFQKSLMPIIAADHSTSRIAEDSNGDGFISLDELRIKNQVKDQVLKGADLDGDGVVSQKEAVLASNNPLTGNNDMDEAKQAMEEVSRILAAESSSSAEIIAEHLAQLINSQGLTRANVRDFMSKIDSEIDLSVEA